jgi:hypothetical protein
LAATDRFNGVPPNRTTSRFLANVYATIIAFIANSSGQNENKLQLESDLLVIGLAGFEPTTS